MQNPLNKVVFIQKIAAFSSRSFSQIIRLNYVNSSWSDTIQNYSFHLFDKLACNESSYRCEKVLRCALKCNMTIWWILNSLLSSITFLNRIDCLLIACEMVNSTSIETLKFAMDKIEEVGGTEVLVAHITASDEYDKTCLMRLCKSSSSSLEVIKLLMEKINKVGGAPLVNDQLSVTDERDYGRNCINFVFTNKFLLSTEVVQYIFEKSVEAGGLDLIKKQLTARDDSRWTCIMHLCFNNCETSSEVLQLVSQKIFEIGGPELLKNQLTAKDDRGSNCFMILCRYSSSSIDDKIKLFCDKCVELCGPEALKNLLSAVDRDDENCLMHMCSMSSLNSSEMFKLICIKSVQVGGLDFLKQLLTATNEYRRSCFQICADVSRSTSSILRFIASLLYYLHVDVFKEQYANMNSHQQNMLKEKANIENDSWVPDAESIAEVKRIISSGGEGEKQVV